MKKTDQFKQQAAKAAIEFIEDGMALGLGSGSTAKFALKEIAQRLKTGQLRKITGIPSSRKTEHLAKKYGIPLTDFSKVQSLDMVIDGADEVDQELNLIKGGGGALLREKILAQAAKRVIIMVDEGKISRKLGQKWPVPVEVLPFARESVARFLKGLDAIVSLRYDRDRKICLTDQKNYILDANFGIISDPEMLAENLNRQAGIIEHGLFIDLASDVIVAGKKGISRLKKYNVI